MQSDNAIDTAHPAKRRHVTRTWFAEPTHSAQNEEPKNTKTQSAKEFLSLTQSAEEKKPTEEFATLSLTQSAEERKSQFSVLDSLFFSEDRPSPKKQQKPAHTPQREHPAYYERRKVGERNLERAAVELGGRDLLELTKAALLYCLLEYKRPYFSDFLDLIEKTEPRFADDLLSLPDRHPAKKHFCAAIYKKERELPDMLTRLQDSIKRRMKGTRRVSTIPLKDILLKGFRNVCVQTHRIYY